MICFQHLPRQCALTAVVLMCMVLSGYSQDQSQSLAVRKIVDTFFEGMKLGDSSMVHSTLMDEVKMNTIFRNKDGEPVLLKEDSPVEFLESVGTAHEEVYNEPIWNVVIQIDGDFAQVWCDYAFYLGNTFHHCGVDAFQLFRSSGGWKIFHITDTRRKTSCEIPDEIKNLFK